MASPAKVSGMLKMVHAFIPGLNSRCLVGVEGVGTDPHDKT